MTKIVKIPCDESIPLIEEVVTSHIDHGHCGGDAIPSYLHSQITNDISGDNVIVDTTPLIRMTHPNSHSEWETMAGLYVYSISSTAHSKSSDDDSGSSSGHQEPRQQQSSTTSESSSNKPNIRATRLAMACGWHSQRFFGDVFVGRLGYVPRYDVGQSGYQMKNLDLAIEDVMAGFNSPDLRRDFQAELCKSRIVNGKEEDAQNNISSCPSWLENASQKNYLDGASLSALATAMTRTELSDDDGDDDSSSSSSSLRHEEKTIEKPTKTNEKQALTEITLCLHCRGPASTLCKGCGGAYFCDEPRRCKANGWSHQCICPTWKLYVHHRDILSSFPYFSGWQEPLLAEDCFSSDETYRNYLSNALGVIDSKQFTPDPALKPPKNNWWATELYGWSGGASLSAKHVDPRNRVSYVDGFAMKGDATCIIPDERRVTKEDIDAANDKYAQDTQSKAKLIQTDEHGLPLLTSWEAYYRLRSLSQSSPVALLATFPLTVYYAIQRYGIVPLTVAQMMEKPLKIHVVGVEKELNFVDLFREVGFLLPESVTVEMAWVVREDMFPQSRGPKSLSMQLATNVKLSIVGGTYGDSLDPNFDISGGPPDMIIGMNAGLYAYESWRHVISYLHHHPNVIGVFTDYNEHSGMNCASLGGGKARKSLEMNPFRQPRAMPVYCMNLPQLSNGFVYVFNEQELDD